MIGRSSHRPGWKTTNLAEGETVAIIGRAFVMLTLCLAAAVAASAERYPSRPLRMIVPFPPGGGVDVVLRLIQPKLARSLGEQMVVDNRPGASGSIAMELAAGATPDGYNLVTYSASMVIYSALNRTRYDLFTDFQPITQFTAAPYVLVVYPGLPVQSVKDLVAYAKAQPGKLNYATPGSGSLQHLAAEWFATATNIRMTQIPYKGIGPAVPDLTAGRSHLLFASVTSMVPHIRSGRLRAVAVTTARRTRELPDAVTLIEAGLPDFLVTQWIGAAAPKATPRRIIDLLHREMAKALREPDVSAALERDGTDAVGSTPSEFTAHIRAEHDKWLAIAKRAGIAITR
jgi:tripartite-type tricarboxylate transporter receptor subunit TctC